MNKTKTGVVFTEKDYAGFMIRLIIMAIDLTIIYLVFLAGYQVDEVLYQNYGIDSPMAYLYVPALISYLYLTVAKASSYGSIGQMLTNTKILHISGKRPNIFQMSYRLLFWLAGPFNFVYDLAWIGLNKEKRTLRDSLCNTIVVKRNAEPTSNHTQIRNVRALVFGFHFLYDTPNP
jgi:uncharacterized RDD family membrane protein YckC